MILTIDPGSRCTGWALWGWHKELIHAATAAGDTIPAEVCNAVMCVCALPVQVVIERPEEQKGRRRKPRVNDLIKLSITAGMLAGHFQTRGSRIVWIRPYDWKGAVPKPDTNEQKYIIAQRVADALAPHEKRHVCIPRLIPQQWDLWDAIGIGLVHLKRCDRGVKPKGGVA